MKKGKLKNDLLVGHREGFTPKTIYVVIINEEDHPIYGKRYKVATEDVWIEENAFEYIVEE